MASSKPPINLSDRHVKGKMKIASLLKELGFSTGGFHSNPFLSSEYGYGEGFDEFFEGPRHDKIPHAVQSALYGFGVARNKAPITDGEEISRRASVWLGNTRGSAFLWVHFMDTHFPYIPYAHEFGIVKSLRNRAMWEQLMLRKVQYRRMSVSPRVRNLAIESYRTCLSRVDNCISHILSRAFRMFDKRLVIVTADHGESFWEDSQFGHLGLHDRILRVPLVVHSNETPSGISIADTVALSDIFPTMIGFLDLEQPDDLFGRQLPSTSTPNKTSQERMILCTSLDPPLNRRLVGARGRHLKFLREMGLYTETPVSERLLELPAGLGPELPVQDNQSEEASLLRRYVSEMLRDRENAQIGYLPEEEKQMSDRLRALGYE
jgi:arylsulfatase A-like enzyme